MEQQKIITGGLIKDVSPDHVPNGSYTDARNIVVSDPTSGDYSRVEKIVGSKAVTHSLGYTITKVLGSCSDYKNGILYYFAETSTGNKIISVTLDDTVSTVIDYDFGWTSTTRIDNIYFLQNSLIWIDNSDEIKRLPLGVYPVTPTAGSLSTENISIMKKAPLQAPYVVGQRSNPDPDKIIDRGSDYQFSYYYEYMDGGKSVISPISKVFARKNAQIDVAVEDYEYSEIKLYVPIPTGDVVGGSTLNASIAKQGGTDDVPKTVKKIVVCGKRIRSAIWFEIDSISRENDASYDTGLGKFSSDFVEFSGTLTGIAVPSVQYSTQHFVPRNPKAIEVAQNRILAANFSEGREAPVIKGVFSPKYDVFGGFDSVDTEARTDVLKMDYYAITWNATNQKYDYVNQNAPEYVVLTSTAGYLDTDYNPATYTKGTLVTLGAFIDLSGTGTQNKTPTTFYRYIEDVSAREKNVKVGTNHTWSGVYSGEKEMGIPGTTPDCMGFSSESAYKMAAVCSDKFGRKSDVVYLGDVSFGPEKIWASGITYEIDIDTLDLPSWAKNIEVLITKNTEKEYLLCGRASHTAYSKNDNDGNEYKSGTFALPNFGLAVSIEGLLRQGYGYSFEDGDRLKLMKLEEGATDTVQVEILDEPITGQDGNYLFVSGEDYTGTSLINPWEDYEIEIYRKRDSDVDSIFYGNGQQHILESGRNTLRGELSGDLFLDFRKKFDPYDTGSEASVKRSDDAKPWVQEMTMSLDEDGAWVQPVGKAYIETNFGEVEKEYYVRFGGKIINDTKINGLGEFLALDEVNTNAEFGEINKLKLVGDDQGQGTVVLAFSPLRVNSLYIGSSVLSNADGTTSMIKSEDFIGMVRPQSKEYGTIHPESVLAVKGKVFFYDNINSCFVMYASNGLHEISSNGLDQFFREKPLKTSEVTCGYYDTYEMLLITIKDGYNSFNDTVGFDTNNKAWRSFYDVLPDNYARMNDVMYITSGNNIGKCRKVAADDTTYANWFGVQKDSSITIPFNEAPGVRKFWTVMSIDMKPDALQWGTDAKRELVDQSFKLEFSNEDGQFTDSIDGEFDIENETIYATLGLDQNSPGGATDGEEMMSKSLEVKISASDGNQIQIGELTLGYAPVSGQAIP